MPSSSLTLGGCAGAVIDCHPEWCGPCKAIKSTFRKIFFDYGDRPIKVRESTDARLMLVGIPESSVTDFGCSLGVSTAGCGPTYAGLDAAVLHGMCIPFTTYLQTFAHNLSCNSKSVPIFVYLLLGSMYAGTEQPPALKRYNGGLPFASAIIL
eukprot:1196024-Prorocentrum_minimum.AAC.8